MYVYTAERSAVVVTRGHNLNFLLTSVNYHACSVIRYILVKGEINVEVEMHTVVHKKLGLGYECSSAAGKVICGLSTVKDLDLVRCRACSKSDNVACSKIFNVALCEILCFGTVYQEVTDQRLELVRRVAGKDVLEVVLYTVVNEGAEYVNAKMGIPFVSFDGDQTDPNVFSQAQYETRVQALAEMMEANK